jgi:phospholipid/cholesterol/gamma-HCH transport system substrate-binding protein
MKVNEQLHGLVRTDSVVTVDTEGVVGDTFLTIHSGSPNAAIAQADSVLQSKPPVTMSDLLSHGLGIMNDADATIKQVGGKLNVALDWVNGAVGNANDLLVGLKEGRGPAGMLLRDEKMAGQIRVTMSNARSTTSNLNRASGRIDSLVADVQQRGLPQKLDDTMTQIRSASTRADATIQQVQQSLTQALGPDVNGVTAGQNISESLSNVNVATGNMAEDTEALKHNFFFKGFFKHCGYYTLGNLSPEKYRHSKLFGSTQSPRAWLQTDALFQHGPHGTEELSPDGKHAIDARRCVIRRCDLHASYCDRGKFRRRSVSRCSFLVLRTRTGRSQLPRGGFPGPFNHCSSGVSCSSRGRRSHHSRRKRSGAASCGESGFCIGDCFLSRSNSGDTWL